MEEDLKGIKCLQNGSKGSRLISAWVTYRTTLQNLLTRDTVLHHHQVPRKSGSFCSNCRLLFHCTSAEVRLSKMVTLPFDMRETRDKHWGPWTASTGKPRLCTNVCLHMYASQIVLRYIYLEEVRSFEDIGQLKINYLVSPVTIMT